MGTILVVDDEAGVCDLVVDFFGEIKGHRVYTANNSVEAMDQARKYQPQVALLDIMLPGVHGVEILRQLRHELPNIKAIMITGVDDEAIAQEAIDAGAVDFVTKPLDMNYLDTLVTFNLLE